MVIDKIICVGKNYLLHAMELGDAVPEKPVLFLKPASILKQAKNWNEQLVLVLPQDADIQPECEIVLQVRNDGYKMNLEEAQNAISAVTIGLDMTLRSRQTELKKRGHPWTTAKVFVDAAVIGPWISYESFKNYMDVEFKLEIDGAFKQVAKGHDMMMHPIDLIMYISNFFPLKKGDIIYTGTPMGVTSILKQSKAGLYWGNYNFSVIWQ